MFALHFVCDRCGITAEAEQVREDYAVGAHDPPTGWVRERVPVGVVQVGPSWQLRLTSVMLCPTCAQAVHEALEAADRAMQGIVRAALRAGR